METDTGVPVRQDDVIGLSGRLLHYPRNFIDIRPPRNTPLAQWDKQNRRQAHCSKSNAENAKPTAARRRGLSSVRAGGEHCHEGQKVPRLHDVTE